MAVPWVVLITLLATLSCPAWVPLQLTVNVLVGSLPRANLALVSVATVL